ncbi:hypothetical protein Q6U62_004603 [Vibrio parahaemolyticus]|uniref:hypothetical protein n=1 Tax=Vibrio parahaemolyticus TaxID=670 RepID=UPI00193F8168|nr:hypothetical protein [Vibrio parahaemolyticus]HAS8314477.1 hypothetical protein [Vibrio vulnificus]HBC3492653.1 hypothetical protein [Vibrio alginolyticus]EJC1078518.1 hypothetical protein [Vibrio parahaemolyticus]EJK2183541.1 hypothetical protein [Vibrio parahaemolyticus]ELA7772607.1 hypothetical protein [Vibrio parahaemolyticus]
MRKILLSKRSEFDYQRDQSELLRSEAMKLIGGYKMIMKLKYWDRMSPADKEGEVEVVETLRNKERVAE